MAKMSMLLPGSETCGFDKRAFYRKTLALLGACCLFLSAVEYLLPKPLPFLRIGIANLPLMLALDIFPFGTFLILVCIKVFGQALITGTLFSYVFLFSLTGTFFSALLMFALRRILKPHRITFVGIGTAGAMVSNVSQLALAHVFIFRESARYIAPPFLAAGLITGIALGVFCEVFTRQRAVSSEQGAEGREQVAGSGASVSENNFYERLFSARALFVTGLFIMPALLFNPSTEFRVLLFLFLWFLVWLFGRNTKPLLTILVIAGIVAFNLLIPYGRVLFSFGPFKITSGALTAGIHRAVTFEALIMLSKLSIRQDLKIPGAFGDLLGESLRIFSAMMNRKFRITPKTFIADIDNLLLELNAEEIPAPVARKQKTTPAGYAVLVIVIILSWLPWLISFLKQTPKI